MFNNLIEKIKRYFKYKKVADRTWLKK